MKPLLRSKNSSNERWFYSLAERGAPVYSTVAGSNVPWSAKHEWHYQE
jgi:hypothetical protein